MPTRVETRQPRGLLLFALLPSIITSTPLLHAVQSDDADALASLLGGSSPPHLEQTCENGFTPLHWAVRMGSETLTRLLLHAGAARRTAGPLGYTALHMASATGQAHLIPLLLSTDKDSWSSRAATAALNDDGWSALHVAAGAGDASVIAALLSATEAGGVDRRGANGFRALHLASEQGHAEATRQLLHAGAAPEAASDGGLTPLCVAVREGHQVSSQPQPQPQRLTPRRWTRSRSRPHPRPRCHPPQEVAAELAARGALLAPACAGFLLRWAQEEPPPPPAALSRLVPALPSEVAWHILLRVRRPGAAE